MKIQKPKKGQLAVETLLIYGVAILIVMLAIGALIGFGVLDLGSLLPDNCDLGDFKCDTYAISPNQVQFELINNMNKNIKEFNITVDGEGNFEGMWNCQPLTYNNSIVVQGDKTKPPVSIACDIKIPPGKKITGTITATISFVGSQIPRTIKGKIRASVSD